VNPLASRPLAERLRRFWRWIAVVLLLGGAGTSVTSRARADDAAGAGGGGASGGAVVTAPRDVPLVLQPQSVKIPSVPATYLHKDLGWLQLSYAPNAHERVQPILADAEQIKAQLADALGQPVLAHVEVRIARTFEDMSDLAPPEIGVPAYASGVAYSGLHLVLLTLTAPRTNEAVDLGEVFRHELAHVALEDAVMDHHVPRWFNEGLALYLSGENRLSRTQTLWNATLSKSILPLSDLDRSFPDDNYEVSVAYAESADFVRFLLRDADRERFASFIARTRRGEPFDRALADAYGTDLRKLEFQWREEIAKRYTFLPVLTGGSLLWVLVLGAMVYGWAKRRRRTKATLARWEQEEAAADEAVLRAHRERADRADRGDRPELAETDDTPAPPMVRPVSVPKVEHDGSWHTLH
jgi:hypothetical protein